MVLPLTATPILIELNIASAIAEAPDKSVSGHSIKNSSPPHLETKSELLTVDNSN